MSEAGMKITDDYHAKIKLWAANPTVVPLPNGAALPKFSPRRFSNHREMNEWKRQLLKQMASDANR